MRAVDPIVVVPSPNPPNDQFGTRWYKLVYDVLCGFDHPKHVKPRQTSVASVALAVNPKHHRRTNGVEHQVDPLSFHPLRGYVEDCSVQTFRMQGHVPLTCHSHASNHQEIDDSILKYPENTDHNVRDHLYVQSRL